MQAGEWMFTPLHWFQMRRCFKFLMQVNEPNLPSPGDHVFQEMKTVFSIFVDNYLPNYFEFRGEDF